MESLLLTVPTALVMADQESNSCYLYPSCTATEFYDQTSGFTNDTGKSPKSFSSMLSSSYSRGWDQNLDLCCQICLPGTPPVVCFDDTDPDCLKKTGNGDYDFLLLSQIWQPQLCESLDGGHDPTLTHLNGTLCSSDAPQDLRIHGLWPNYINGYPQCCNSTTSPSFTLDPAEVTQWDIYPLLQSDWAGVVHMDTCAVCYTLNHEWLKHGGCYSPGDPMKYFRDSLTLAGHVSAATEIINSLKGTVVETSSLESLYARAVNVICDPYAPQDDDETGRFLEIRTCWDREGTPIDCPPASATQFAIPCPTYSSLGAL
jgi:ribonuclease T2